MLGLVDFSDYLRSLVAAYNSQQDLYTLTDLQVEIRIEQPASLGAPEAEQEVRVERSPVLAGLRKYVQQGHVLLVGKPGSGKSTALQRWLWEEATIQTSVPLQTWEVLETSQVSIHAPRIPVLVELRSYDASIEHLIQKFLRRHGLRLSLETIDELLFEGRLLLLLDGVNELPTEALGAVETFRKDNSRCPMIFTTRELGAGAGLGITQKLEMCGLTEPQMRELIQKQLPGQADSLLRQLKDRLRELAETPLLLKILCDVFQADGQIPKSRGELFRKQFAQQYEQFKRLPEVMGDSSHLLPQLLQTLAFEMMQGIDPTKPTQFVLQLPKATATEKLQQWLQTDREKANHYLQALLKHHLLQQSADPNQVEFCHQLFQEYYAAESLLLQLHILSDAQLKRDYLNLLKWTEPLAMMAALIPDQTQAVRIVKLALEVDWKLGTRLSGEVLPKFQEKPVGMVSALEVPEWLKVELLGETRSDAATPESLQALQDQSFPVRSSAKAALGNVRQTVGEALEDLRAVEAISNLLKALEHINWEVREASVEALGRLNSVEAISGLLKALEDTDWDVRRSAAEGLGRIGSVKAIPGLFKMLEHKKKDVRISVAETLGKLGAVEAIPGLLELLKDENRDVRRSATEALGRLNSAAAIPDLLKALEDVDGGVRRRAVEALGKLGAVEAISSLLGLIEDADLSVCLSAAEVLGDLRAVKAIPSLLNALEFTNWAGRERAAEALVKLGSIEVIPVLLQALQDEQLDVRQRAGDALVRLGSMQAVPGLLQALQYQDYSVRLSTVEVIQKLGAAEAIPVMLQTFQNKQLDIRFGAIFHLRDEPHYNSWPPIYWDLEDKYYVKALEVLGKLGATEAISVMLPTLQHEHDQARKLAAEALGNFKDDRAAHILPDLLKLIPTRSGEDAFHALTLIQANCQFYNYDIFQSPSVPAQPSSSDLLDKIDQTTQQINQRTKRMADQPNITISGGTFPGSVYFATHHGDNIGTQNNYFGTDEALKRETADLRQFIAELETRHPDVQTEAEADNILDAEIVAVQTTNPTHWQILRHQMTLLKRHLLNPERHLQATKATLIEVAKSAYEKSLIVKAVITYIDKLSEEPNHGA